MSPPLVWTNLSNGFTSDVNPINALGNKVVELETNFTATNPFVLKFTDETLVGPSTTLQDDNELFVSLPANTVYSMHGHMLHNTNASAAFKFDMTLPGGTTWYSGFFICGVSTPTQQMGTMTTPAVTGATGFSADSIMDWWSTFKTGGAAGLLTIRWAQSTGHASNAIVRAGSYLELVRRG